MTLVSVCFRLALRLIHFAFAECPSVFPAPLAYHLLLLTPVRGVARPVLFS